MAEVAVNGDNHILFEEVGQEGVSKITDNSLESKENFAVVANGLPSVNDRLKRRAKRPSKFLSKDLRTNSDTQVIAPLRALKNSRKSRSGFGRGLPKKGGAGGKGTWGALGSELAEDEEEANLGALDANDPNYDEANPFNKDVKLKVYDLTSTHEEIRKRLTSIIAEYYDHGDTQEVYLSFDEMNSMKNPNNVHLIVVSAIELAMDHKPSHREMTSVLLADLYSSILYSQDYAKGYDTLLNNLNELVLDTPDACTILGNFIARSIADDCIPPKFLQNYKGKVTCEKTIAALSRAESLLSMKHGLVRLDGVWGVGGGTRPVKYLVKKMILLLQEYLSSLDIEEATRCLVELEVPHFHHELVYEAVNMVIEKVDDRTASLMCDLLKSLCVSVVITPKQMNEGFFRIYDDLAEIALDVPAAYTITEKFVNRCQSAKIINEDVVRRIPLRGRKRFVSEGDGGRVKEDAFY